MLTVAGFQAPVIPLLDVAGKIGAAEPEQMAGTALNIGVMIEFTVTDIFAVVAHSPALGVNVYVVFPCLIIFIQEGVQVPEIPFVEVAGKTGALLYRQSGPIGSNRGLPLAAMVISMVEIVEH